MTKLDSAIKVLTQQRTYLGNRGKDLDGQYPGHACAFRIAEDEMKSAIRILENWPRYQRAIEAAKAGDKAGWDYETNTELRAALKEIDNVDLKP